MNDKPKPHPRNALGDFYVEDGCCTACLAPEEYAPNLMGFDESDCHCFIAKQPSNEEEIYQAIKITWAAELQCIRYLGENPQILRRLAEIGMGDSCDQQSFVRGIKPLLRNHVTFENYRFQSEFEIANQFREHITNLNNEYVQFKVTKIKTDRLGVTFSFNWYEKKYYTIWFTKTEMKDTWHIFHSLDYEEIGSKGISLKIDDWLRSDNENTKIKWFTNNGWNKSLAEWQETPF